MATETRTLLIATNNQGKVNEYRQMLSDVPGRLLTLSDLPRVREVEETGSTFEENARLKAGEYALRTGYVALADDSGLEVAALGNRPGVLSARYGGSNTDYHQKMAKLLDELARTGDLDRHARFVCSVAAADETGTVIITATGVCNGSIALEPRGMGGFGYDPIFIPEGFDHSFGELSSTVKQEISHRARAFKQIIPFLRDYNAV